MTETDEQKIERWLSSPEVATDLAIHAYCIAVDDLTDAVKTRSGAQMVRANYKLLREHKHKFDDIFRDMGMFAIAAE